MQEFLFIGILGILRRCKAMQQFTVHHSNCTVLVLTLHHPPYCFLTMTSTFRLGFKEELALTWRFNPALEQEPSTHFIHVISIPARRIYFSWVCCSLHLDKLFQVRRFLRFFLVTAALSCCGQAKLHNVEVRFTTSIVVLQFQEPNTTKPYRCRIHSFSGIIPSDS